MTCRRFEPLLLEIEQELAQGLQDVAGVHHGPLGHAVGVDEDLLIEEWHHHLLAPDVKDLGLPRGCLGFLKNCFNRCFLSVVWKDTAG